MHFYCENISKMTSTLYKCLKVTQYSAEQAEYYKNGQSVHKYQININHIRISVKLNQH